MAYKGQKENCFYDLPEATRYGFMFVLIGLFGDRLWAFASPRLN